MLAGGYVSDGVKQATKYGRLVALLWAVALALQVAHAQGSPTVAQVTGRVRMIIGDRTFPYPHRGVKLTFRGSVSGEFETTIDEAGDYTADLSPDTYRLTVQYETCSVQRAPFKAIAHDKLVFNFILASCPIYDSEEVSVPAELSEEPSREDNYRPGKYKEQTISANRSLGIPEIHVVFGTSNREGPMTIYSSFKPMKASRWALVSLTVDKYTVEARKIWMDSDTMGFKADGEVSVADGKGTVRGTSAVFHFRHGRLIVKVSGSPESDAD